MATSNQNLQVRTGEITFQGNPLTLLGPKLTVGEAAPDFVVLQNDLSEAKLSDFSGKTIIISVVPSLDTPVCDMQARRFNEEAGKREDIVVLTVSMDLPFAQQRWCGAANAKNVVTVSDHRDASFGAAYGVLIQELRLLARAVFVVGVNGKIMYVQIVPEITELPDFDAALAAAK
jgi:thiol peroxidase